MFGRNPQQRNDEKVFYNSGEKNPFSRKRLQQNQAEGGAAICRDWLVGEGKEEWKTKGDNIVIQWVSYQQTHTFLLRATATAVIFFAYIRD